MVDCIPHINERDREATRQYVEECFSARFMAENYVKIYSKII